MSIGEDEFDMGDCYDVMTLEFKGQGRARARLLALARPTPLGHFLELTGQSPGRLFWPLILRGVGRSLLFAPFTTLALATLRGLSMVAFCASRC